MSANQTKDSMTPFEEHVVLSGKGYSVPDQVQSGAVDFIYTPTNDMAADGTTKSLDRIKLHQFTGYMGLVQNRKLAPTSKERGKA